MHAIEEFVDERNKSWCVHCGEWIGSVETNRDHAPSRSLLRKPFPQNLPVTEICADCNLSFSVDEEYLFLFLSCVLSGSTDPNKQTDPKAARALRRHNALRRRIQRSKSECRTDRGDVLCTWKPETERIKRVILKNARGHAYYELGEPMLDMPDYIRILPLMAMTNSERGEFEAVQTVPLLPEVGSRMLTRVITGQDLLIGWVNVQDQVYRYSAEQRGSMHVKSVLFEYLATEVFWGDSVRNCLNNQAESHIDYNNF